MTILAECCINTASQGRIRTAGSPPQWCAKTKLCHLSVPDPRSILVRT